MPGPVGLRQRIPDSQDDRGKHNRQDAPHGIGIDQSANRGPRTRPDRHERILGGQVDADRIRPATIDNHCLKGGWLVGVC